MYINQNELALALSHFHSALKLKPDFTEVAYIIVLIYEQQKQSDKALEFLLNFEKENKASAFIHKHVLRLLREFQKYELGIQYLKERKAKNPSDIDTLLQLSEFYFYLKQFKSALRQLQVVQHINPNLEEVNYKLGLLYREMKDYPNAILYFEKIKFDSIYYADSILQRTFYYYQVDKKIQKAIEVLETALENRKDLVSLYPSLASIYIENKESKKAVALLENAAEKFPKDVSILYDLGAVYEKDGQIKQSLLTMRKVLELNPDHPEALNFISYSLAARKENLDEAHQYAQKALKLKPQSGHIADTLGWVYFQQGKFKEAKQFLEKASQLEPKEPIIFFHLGEAYRKLGDSEKALQLYEQALQLNPTQDERPQIQEKIQTLRKRIPAKK
ncbi:MAG: tetratricopeptide repeat protein [Deltaproteobacteria bacterium]|nr:tetratricopeptide repeat protein [Deltaproteobacteria bacterium]